MFDQDQGCYTLLLLTSLLAFENLALTMRNPCIEESAMQLNISGHHVEVTPALKDYVTSKLTRLERHYSDITNAQVTLSVEKLRQIAEASLHIRGREIVANAESEDLYAAIDMLTDKIDRQIIKHKEKLVERLHGAAAR